jgi:uncharacterized membrane protein YeaQ/YmgE (transglycosylase-associated protein family)
MINFVIWMVVGALVGWAASIIMRTNNRQGLISDVLVGIVGAFIGGFFLSPLFGIGTINDGDFSIPAVLVSLGGAVLVLLFTKVFRNVLGYLVFIIVALGIYVYFDCWTVASTSGFCTGVRAMPFLQ